jgi:hypothetical protein
VGGVAVLDPGDGHHDREQQSAGVHPNVAFAGVDLLPVMPGPA